jgi:hypothetical protein
MSSSLFSLGEALDKAGTGTRFQKDIRSNARAWGEIIAAPIGGGASIFGRREIAAAVHQASQDAKKFRKAVRRDQQQQRDVES